MPHPATDAEGIAAAAVRAPERGTPLLGALARSVGIYAAANFATRALNFFLLPLYTRFLSPADYGIISLAEIVATVFITIAGFGFEPALRRLYFQHAENSTEQCQYVGSVLRFSLATVAMGMTLCFAVASITSRTWFSVSFFPYVALALGTAAAGQLTQYRLTLFEVRRRPWLYALWVVLLFALTAGFTIGLVVAARRGAQGMLAGKLLAATVVAAISAAALWPWLRAKWEWRFVRETWPLAWPLMPHQLMALGLVIADRFLLEHYRSLAEVGIYSIAYTCGMAMFLATGSLLQSWSPMFFDLGREREAAKPQLGGLSSALAMGLAAIGILGVLLAPLLVRLLDARYAELAGLIPLVIAGYLFHGFFALLQLPILQGRSSRPILYASSFALVTNLALNILWIPRWGMYGAAYATIVGYALEALIMFAFAQRVHPLSYSRSRILGMLAVFAAAIVFAEWVPASRTFWGAGLALVCIVPVVWATVGGARSGEKLFSREGWTKT